MIIETFTITPFQQNTRVAACGDTKKALCVDPGEKCGELVDFINQNNFELQAIALTHGHLDHIGGVSDLHKNFPAAEILLHQDDENLYYDLPRQPLFFGLSPQQLKPLGMDYEAPPKLTRYWQDGEIYAVGRLRFKLLHCPGHTPGHVVLFEESERKAFSGDCLFEGSIGRTDLPGGDHDHLLNSIKEKILPLGDDVEILPGHGATTTIGREKSANPFLTDVYRLDRGRFV